MTAREQLLQELETLPEELIGEALDYICLIKNRHRPQPAAPPETGKSLGSDWWDNLDRFTPDFMCDRSQPNPPKREDIFP